MRYARLALGTAVLLAACAADPAATSSTPSLSTSPSPPPTAPVSASPLTVPAASPVASPTTLPVPTLVFTEQVFDGNPVAILADTDGWVAVGASEAGAPTAWTSSDAVTWTPHPVPDPNPELREQGGFVGSVMGPMAKWGDTWFSFGTVIGCCDGRGVLAWRSTDGRAWEVIESRSPLFTDGFYVQQLLAHDDGLVARETGYAQYSSRVWTWTPEESWAASDLGGIGIEYEGTRVWLTGLAWDGERFIAVGGPLRGDHDAPPTGGVWVSSDARRWDSVEEPSMAPAALDSVTAVPGGGFLAIGQQDGVPVVWGSADGRTWEARSLPEDDGLAANHVFEAGDVLLAVGFGDDRTAVWMSSDGIAWGAPAVLRPLSVGTSVAAGTADQVLIIGRERTPDGSGSSILFRASFGD